MLDGASDENLQMKGKCETAIELNQIRSVVWHLVKKMLRDRVAQVDGQREAFRVM